MPHIALVTTSYPDASIQLGRDAAGSFVADFAAALAKHVDITVVAPSHASSIERNGNLTVRRFAVPSLPLSLLKPSDPRHWRAIITTLTTGQRTLRHLCQSEKIDHIFALWALPSGYWARTMQRELGIPYSTWALGSDIWSLGKIPIVRSWLRTILRESHTRFADGLVLKEDVEELAGRECHFLPSSRQLLAINQKQLVSQPPYKLAFLGRWHPHKGIDLLLESLQQLTNEDWQRINEVRICGGGPLEELVHQQIQALQAANRPVTVHGYLDKTEATALLTWADYLLLPSRIESIPVVFSDAMQCVTPLVSTPIGDLPRLLSHYQVGVLSAAVDATAYVTAIRFALQRAPVNFQAGLAEAARAFSVDSAAKSFLAAIS